jgi:cytochrome c551/c552
LLEPIGRQAAIAAEAKDSEALFQIGADLYQACVACHNVYMKK